MKNSINMKDVLKSALTFVTLSCVLKSAWLTFVTLCVAVTMFSTLYSAWADYEYRKMEYMWIMTQVKHHKLDSAHRKLVLEEIKKDSLDDVIGEIDEIIEN